MQNNNLSERVCRKLGIEPKRYWTVITGKQLGDPGKFSQKEHAEASLQYYRERYGRLQPWWNDAKVSNEHVVYPDLLTDEWAGKLLAMLAAQKIAVSLQFEPQTNWWACGSNAGPLLWRAGITAPEAICRAIDAMPEGL